MTRTLATPDLFAALTRPRFGFVVSVMTMFMMFIMLMIRGMFMRMAVFMIVFMIVRWDRRRPAGFDPIIIVLMIVIVAIQLFCGNSLFNDLSVRYNKINRFSVA